MLTDHLTKVLEPSPDGTAGPMQKVYPHPSVSGVTIVSTGDCRGLSCPRSPDDPNFFPQTDAPIIVSEQGATHGE